MRKDELADLGKYTTHPINLYKVLTTKEYSLLEFIRFRNGNCNVDISNSLLKIEMGFKNNSNIKEVKENLIKIGFIKVIRETIKGTQYNILYENIRNIVEKLNNEYNPIKRLQIADNLRISKGLAPMHVKTIENFINSSFNYEINEYEINNKETENNKNSINKESKDVINLNNLYNSFINGNITEREYKLKSRSITQNNNKIKFNNDLKQWI